MRSLPGADLYADFSGFSRLRAEARDGSAEGARSAAEQMEALMLGMMIKSMRAGAGGGLAGGAGSTHQSLYDNQMALELARSGKLGFARMMLEQIAPEALSRADPAARDAAGKGRDGAARAAFPAPQRNPALGLSATAPSPAREALASTVKTI